MDLYNKTEEELREIAEAVRLLSEKKKYNFIDFMYPDTGPLCRDKYPKHIAFMNAGSTYGERAFIAANRVGKTLTGLYEMVLHCTGDYPHWWKGKRFNKPVYCWLAGSSGDAIKGSIQRDLAGGAGDYGSGLIPKDKIAKDPYSMAGVAGAIGTYFIKHKSGGMSVIEVKTYKQGKDAFEGARVDVIMLDEECPLEIYVECQMRTLTTNGIVYLTFTPDSGVTDTVLHFLEKPKQGERDKFVIKVGWKDVPHISDEQMSNMLAKIPPHMVAVKTTGEPYLGTGSIYPIHKAEIQITPFDIPRHWPRAFGFDPGWNKTAAIWGAYDRETDCIYLYSEYYQGHAECSVHAKGLRARGNWIPGIADPATEYGSKGKDGIGFLPLYEEEGINLMMANNKNKEEAIFAVYERLTSGRLKIFSTLENWFYEYGMYRRDDNGKIVKKNDHLMDATQYLIRHMLDVMEKEPNESDDYSSSGYNDNDRDPLTGY
jgi:phage terminase large subunit-like protein